MRATQVRESAGEGVEVTDVVDAFFAGADITGSETHPAHPRRRSSWAMYRCSSTRVTLAVIDATSSSNRSIAPTASAMAVHAHGVATARRTQPLPATG